MYHFVYSLIFLTMSILDVVLVVLLVAWIGGFSLKIAGGLIHVLLVIALVILVMRLLGVGSASRL